VRARLLVADFLVIPAAILCTFVVWRIGELWAYRCLGTLLIFVGLYFTLCSYGILRRVRKIDPWFKVFGPFGIVQGFLLLFFNIRL
jgi:hypothetical protein